MVAHPLRVMLLLGMRTSRYLLKFSLPLLSLAIFRLHQLFVHFLFFLELFLRFLLLLGFSLIVLEVFFELIFVVFQEIRFGGLLGLAYDVFTFSVVAIRFHFWLLDN